jgi:hypothetical protein
MRDAKKKLSAEKAQLERDYNSLNHKVSKDFLIWPNSIFVGGGGLMVV